MYAVGDYDTCLLIRSFIIRIHRCQQKRKKKLTIKGLLFLFSMQLFVSFPPENIANYEKVNRDLTDIFRLILS